MGGYAAISGLVYGTPAGTVTIGPYTIAANALADFSSTASTPTSPGNTTVNVPSFAAGVILVPNTANTAALTLKGIAGDTGIAISPNNPSLLSFPTSPPASFVITAGSGYTGLLQIIFF